MDDEPRMIEWTIGGVAEPRGIWRAEGTTGWSVLSDPHPIYEPPPPHKKGDPDEPGYADQWWAKICGEER